MRRALAHRDFRLLWLGQVASTFGDRLVVVALALYVTDIGTPTDVGLVLAAHSVPFLALVLVGGVWADRLPRQRLMITTDVVRGSLHALLAVLIFTGNVEIWHIAVIEAGFGTAEAFFQPAYTGLVPQTVPEELLQEANALSSLVNNVANFLGPAAATALVLGIGAGYAFAIDAVSFCVSALLLMGVRARDRGERSAPKSMLADLREGWREVRSRTWVWTIIAACAVALLVEVAPYLTLGPTIAEQIHGTAAVYGIVAAVTGAGTIAGAVVAARWKPRYPMRAGVLWLLPASASMVAFVLGAPVGALVVVFAISGFGESLFTVWWMTELAQRIPPHLLSRVTSYDWLGSLALMPIGFLAAGPIGQALGATDVLLAGTLIALTAMLACLAVRDVWTLTAAPPAARSHAA